MFLKVASDSISRFESEKVINASLIDKTINEIHCILRNLFSQFKIDSDNILSDFKKFAFDNINHSKEYQKIISIKLVQYKLKNYYLSLISNLFENLIKIHNQNIDVLVVNKKIKVESIIDDNSTFYDKMEILKQKYELLDNISLCDEILSCDTIDIYLNKKSSKYENIFHIIDQIENLHSFLNEINFKNTNKLHRTIFAMIVNLKMNYPKCKIIEHNVLLLCDNLRDSVSKSFAEFIFSKRLDKFRSFDYSNYFMSFNNQKLDEDEKYELLTLLLELSYRNEYNLIEVFLEDMRISSGDFTKYIYYSQTFVEKVILCENDKCINMLFSDYRINLSNYEKYFDKYNINKQIRKLVKDIEHEKDNELYN